MSNFDRIEDLFEPLNGPDIPEPTRPASLDEVMEQYGFDEARAALDRLLLNLEEGTS